MLIRQLSPTSAGALSISRKMGWATYARTQFKNLLPKTLGCFVSDSMGFAPPNQTLVQKLRANAVPLDN